MKTLSAILLLVCFGLSPSTAYAHHSFIMFDRDKVITITGTVKEFQWTNPHVWIQILIPTESGEEEEWGIEAGSPNMLRRSGWRYDTLKPGDNISLTIHPYRDGRDGGSFISMIDENGHTLENF